MEITLKVILSILLETGLIRPCSKTCPAKLLVSLDRMEIPQPEQPIAVFDHPYDEEAFPYLQSKLPMFQI